MQRNFPLILSWDITIHKPHGRTLEMAIIDLGNIKKCSGMTLVALHCVKKLENILLQYFMYWAVEKGEQGQAITNNSIHHLSI